MALPDSYTLKPNAIPAYFDTLKTRNHLNVFLSNF
jgi:hypothetical protein